MNQYGKKDYWNNRYKSDEEPFEWYQKFSALKPILLNLLQEYQNPKILVMGCGNSKISEQLYELGYKKITNIDYSSVLIEQMKEKYKENYPEMQFLEMDASDLVFENNSFDFIIDKGLIDSILCSEGSSQQTMIYVKEVDRVLRQNGRFFCVSYGVPDYRLQYFENDYDWTINQEKIQKPIIESLSEENKIEEKKSPMSYHYIYICHKKVTTQLILFNKNNFIFVNEQQKNQLELYFQFINISAISKSVCSKKQLFSFELNQEFFFDQLSNLQNQ